MKMQEPAHLYLYMENWIVHGEPEVCVTPRTHALYATVEVRAPVRHWAINTVFGTYCIVQACFDKTLTPEEEAHWRETLLALARVKYKREEP